MKFLPTLSLVVLLTACSTGPIEQTTDESPKDPEATMTSPNTSHAYTRHCVEGVEEQGPWDNSLKISWIDGEGNSISAASETLTEAGGVPTIIEDSEGRLIAAFQWFACDDETTFDKVAVSISEDEGETWSEPEPITIEGLPETYQRPFDPTLALLEDGRIRIYYTSNPKGMTTFDEDVNIYSAVSEDGINYTFEEGARFDLEEDSAYDSAVGYWDGLWHLITPNNVDNGSSGLANHGISEDGLNFEIVDDIELEEGFNWTGNFLAKEDGLYFYGTPGINSKGNWFTFTSDGENWAAGDTLSNVGGDPAVVCVEEDRCLAIGVVMGQVSGQTQSTPQPTFPAQK